MDSLFSLRSLFCHPTRTQDLNSILYEERITIWRAADLSAAYDLAEKESEKYASESSSVFLGIVDGFNVYENKLGSGMEVWSVMRQSKLDSKTYQKTFMDTPTDRKDLFFGGADTEKVDE